MSKSITTHKITKFALVGVWNTAFDFFIFNFLIWLGVGSTLGNNQAKLCNIISASIAALVSYELNQRFVFNTGKKAPKHYRLYFIIIVLSGIFIISSVIIGLVQNYGGGLVNEIAKLTRSFGFKFEFKFIQENLAKLTATVFTMVWNYFLFKTFIFKDKQ